MVLMNTQGIIILTSMGLSVESVRRTSERFFNLLPHKSVAIVTTAAEGKENNRYSKLAKSQFKELGFNTVDFVDIESNAQTNFSRYNVIYVCGGNTFKLLKAAREGNFKDAIINLLGRDGIYIGVSAGAIILSPTIQIAASVDPEPNDIGLINLEGLSLVDFEIHPHHDPSHDKELASYQKTTTNKIVKISNSQAIIISDKEQQIIG
jgi:dipeptidase E